MTERFCDDHLRSKPNERFPDDLVKRILALVIERNAK
jgi:hypothetical protein